ncbi:MAG: GntR family transcriptional regulator [Trueperaceae bacterium]
MTEPDRGGRDSFNRLRRGTLAEQVLEAVTNKLFAGELRPGDRLAEAELAAEMGISRSPVREALAELQKDGLLIKEPGRQAVIREWTSRDLEELYDLRAMLEGYAVRLAAERVTPADLSTLHGIVGAMWSSIQREEYQELLHLDFEFHREIWRLSNHSLLQQTLKTISLQTRFFIAINFGIHSDPAEVPRLHQEILNALGKDSPERLEKLLQEHLHRAVKLMLGAYQAGVEALVETS